MPRSTGHILNTPLQSWCRANEEYCTSMLPVYIENAMMKHSCYVIVENVVGLKKSASLKTTLESLKEAGYIPTVLGVSDKTLIVGKR